MKVLIVAPHPDDDIIGCGGSILSHIKKGNEVFIAYITSGDAENAYFTKEDFRELRRKETIEAARLMEVKEKNLFFLKEEVLDINLARTQKGLMEIIRKIKPSMVYIPHSGETTHPDHKTTHEIAMSAIRFAPGPWFRKQKDDEDDGKFNIDYVFGFEITEPIKSPNCLENITDFFKRKIEALKAHKSQNSIDFTWSVTGLNMARARKQDRYAEAFELIKCPAIS